MARSPWKFLVGLTKRRGKDEAAPAEETPATSSPIEAREETATTDPQDAPAAAKTPVRDATGELDAAKTIKSDSDDTVERPKPRSDDVVPSPASAPEAGISEPQISARSRKTVVPRRQAKPAEPPAARTEVQPNSRAHISTEIRELDDEIKHLRRQLAERLQSQNTQLKKMLERFEQ
ncbi:hypothetical protein FZ934_21975 (plasmid) [Rhizobium grahamii]|uniref:Uncharacterized protein n=1 Tax=Rhizobium grahamii TaxID=1120045 RepID=A0A5Q0CG63_9HYPH|nr:MULTISPECIES: hypothetical protein [Rhizobium]QFY62997.1 hypothetical protein FZ934_21975 [Rhizobium grahamii]QRM52247.1 hypothetical protein F3Y33_23680 [Rhizobium sp. BG6]